MFDGDNVVRWMFNSEKETFLLVFQIPEHKNFSEECEHVKLYILDVCDGMGTTVTDETKTSDGRG